MKDRYQNLTRGLALGAGISTAFLAGGCAIQDITYRDKTLGISIPTDEGDIYCYTDILPQNRLYTIENADGTEHRWFDLELNDYACDLPREGILGLKTGEQVSYSGFSGSADIKEPVLERLK